ncbi:MAG: LysR family transcriptional regulator [Xanthomonadales bacterium]|nr:LysR family transcriptional regulator [Xanthomonadales bacterium]MCC6595875.1 LysR family transcriptional regulator [Rhodanobacteraceae bacterium]MCW5578190.1 LysR family transcriptional regulator [Dokdonella sp.]MDL1870233.1 LysR family transcriptional regulator [Gammaproteobacteria bacterium PRO6]
MTLAQLRYLIAIADSGLNITLAAERVHATQPGLSKQLKQLEEELGFTLFTRRGKSLDAVTAAGATVIERARIIVAEAANIRALAANLRNEAHGDLRIATTHTQARYALPGAIAGLRKRFPDVGVHLQPGGDAEILELLDRGETDLAVISTAGHRPEGLALPVYRWERVALVPRGHALTKLGRAPTLADLAAFPLVSYESSLKPDSSLRRAFEGAGLELKLAFTARDADLIRTYVGAGLGVGILAEMALDAGDRELVALPIDGPLPSCTTWIVLRRDRVLRDYALEFIARLAPQLDRRDVRRAFDHGIAADQWPAPPRWRELDAARLAA